MILNIDDYNTITELTSMDYEPYKVKNEEEKVFLTDEKIKDIIHDLICAVGVFEEKYTDLKNNVLDNYVPRKMSDYTGDSYDDRF